VFVQLALQQGHTLTMPPAAPAQQKQRLKLLAREGENQS
jgi:hypothetical protein